MISCGVLFDRNFVFVWISAACSILGNGVMVMMHWIWCDYDGKVICYGCLVLYLKAFGYDVKMFMV